MLQMEALFRFSAPLQQLEIAFLNYGEYNDLWKEVDEAEYVWIRKEKLLNDLGGTHGEKVAKIISAGHNERSKGSVISCSKRNCI